MTACRTAGKESKALPAHSSSLANMRRHHDILCVGRGLRAFPSGRQIAPSCPGVKALDSVKAMSSKKTGKKAPPKPRNPMARALAKGELYRQRVAEKPSRKQRQQQDALKAREDERE